MAIEYKLPKLGLTMTKAVIGTWQKKIGDFVKQGDILLDIETDKISIEHESLDEGYLVEILASEGEEKSVGDIICILNKENIIPQKKASSTVSKKSTERVLISPLAKRLAKENNIDFSEISGSGTNGRIEKQDILYAIEVKESTETREAPIPAPTSAPAPSSIISDSVETGEKVKLSPMRKTIAERLSYSKSHIPHVYFKAQINAENLQKIKNSLQKKLIEKKGVKLTYTHLIIKAAAIALTEYPSINASFADDSIIKHKTINIGLAVSLTDGLIVPVIKDIKDKNLYEIISDTENLVKKAKEGKLSPEDISGGSFTVSNLGMYDIDEFIPIINPPEAGILGVGCMKERVVADNGQLYAKMTINLVLSIDHRIVDGAAAAGFLSKIKDLLENPTALFLF